MRALASSFINRLSGTLGGGVWLEDHWSCVFEGHALSQLLFLCCQEVSSFLPPCPSISVSRCIKGVEQDDGWLGWGGLVTLLVAVVKYPDKNSFGKGGVILAHSSSV